MLGIMATLDEKYDDAEAYFGKAQDALDKSDSEIFEECYRAINDICLGRIYFETGRFDECRQMLDKWEGNPMFDQDIYREILLRDLIVPYYQVRCMYEIAMIYEDGAAKADIMEKESELEAIFRDFIDICEENGYMKAELYTLLRLQVRATAMF